MRDQPRWTLDEIQELAARGAGKVDLLGPRGATLVSLEETAAMAAMLAILGVRPIHPGSYPAPNHTPSTEGGRA